MPRTSPCPTAHRWEGLDHLEPRQLMAFAVWDGGGGDNDWDNPLNWSGDALPGANDNVLIDSPGHATIHRSHNTSASIASLWTLNPLDVSAGTLSIAGQWKQSAPLFMSGGRITAESAALMNGDVLWIGGTLDGAGAIGVLPGRQFTIAGSVTLSKSLYNNGTLRWTSGDITTNGGTIQNLSGRVFQIQSAGTLTSSGAATSLVNYGTMIRDGAPGTTTTINAIFSNYSAVLWIFGQPPPPVGELDVRSGTLSFTGPVIQKQGVTLTGNSIWKVSSSTARLLLLGPDLIAASGTFVLNGAGSEFPVLEGVSSLSGNLTLSGGRAFTFSSIGPVALATIGRLVINNPGMTTVIPMLQSSDLEIEAGDVVIQNGMTGSFVRIAENASLTLGGWNSFQKADIGGAGLLRLTGNMSWTAGTIDGPGQWLITPSGQLSVDTPWFGFNQRSLTRRTVNHGVITMSGSIHTFPYDLVDFQLSAELVNRGTININYPGFISTTSGTGTASAPGFITNFGTINTNDTVTFRGAGGGIRLNNQGTVHALHGTLFLNGGAYGVGGTWIADSGAELSFGGLGSYLGSATLSGAGRIRVAAETTWQSVTITGAGELLVTAPGRFRVFWSANHITRSLITNNGRMVVDGIAAIIGNFVNNGDLDLKVSMVSLTGNLTLGSSSVLRVTNSGPQTLARVDIAGSIALAGTFVGTFDWPATVGDRGDFFTAASRSGVFSAVLAPGAAPFATPLFLFEGNVGRIHLAIV